MLRHYQDRMFAFGTDAVRQVDEAFLSSLAQVCVAESRVSVGGGNWPVDVCYTALSRAMFEVRGTGDWGHRTLDFLLSFVSDILEALPQSRARVLAGSLGAELIEAYTAVTQNSFDQLSEYAKDTAACITYWETWNSLLQCGTP